MTLRELDTCRYFGFTDDAIFHDWYNDPKDIRQFTDLLCDWMSIKFNMKISLTRPSVLWFTLTLQQSSKIDRDYIFIFKSKEDKLKFFLKW